MWFSARFAEPTRKKAITWDVWAISVPAISELTRQATAAGQGGTTRFACNRNVKIIENTYGKRVNSAKRVNSLSRDNSPM